MLLILGSRSYWAVRPNTIIYKEIKKQEQQARVQKMFYELKAAGHGTNEAAAMAIDASSGRLGSRERALSSESGKTRREEREKRQKTRGEEMNDVMDE